MKLIDKDALVAEIERRLDKLSNTSIEDNKEFAAVIGAQHYELISLVQYINTLEVKEVDLDESARHYLLHEHISPLNEVLHHADLKVEMQYHKDIEDTYKAGFELGLKSKGE